MSAEMSPETAAIERLLFGCYICQPDNPNASEEGCADCDERAALRQRADHFQFAFEQAAEGKCWASGMALRECRQSICDCFDFAWLGCDSCQGEVTPGWACAFCGLEGVL